MGLLPDSRIRRRKPLRDMLRAGQIGHAYQDGAVWLSLRSGRGSG
jgi:hypothetical protein